MKFRIYDNKLNMYVTNNEIWSITSCGEIVNSDGCIEEDVNRYTVERCFGMKDSNDKDIYENDIVDEIYEIFDGEPFTATYVAEFNKENLTFELAYYYTNGNRTVYVTNKNDNLEIVGNTHEKNSRLV